MWTKFQSTHPSRGATLPNRRREQPRQVSIHAPLAGCDRLAILRATVGSSFNPRTPRGVRLGRGFLFEVDYLFQSTHPSRGATPCLLNTGFDLRFQSTHPSRGATANGPTKGTFCHVFMGVTRHKYDFSRRFVPRPSFGTVLPPIFYHAIFCSLHLRAHKEPLR